MAALPLLPFFAVVAIFLIVPTITVVVSAVFDGGRFSLARLQALVGLIIGAPLGIALGRAIWRTVAGFTPLAYHPPVALLALLLIAPAALLAANALAAWPQHQPLVRS